MRPRLCAPNGRHDADEAGSIVELHSSVRAVEGPIWMRYIEVSEDILAKKVKHFDFGERKNP